MTGARVAPLAGTTQGFSSAAAAVLVSLGYTDVSMLEGGLQGWIAAGGEVFRPELGNRIPTGRRHRPLVKQAVFCPALAGAGEFGVAGT